MATITNNLEMQVFSVIHPLDDIPEKKCSVGDAGQIAMTRSVKISLMALRGYLLLMIGLLGYHVLDLAGIFHGGLR